MNARRSVWFTVDLRCPLTEEEQIDLLEYLDHWDYGTFVVVRTRTLRTCNWVLDLFDRVISKSPYDVRLADDVFSILDRLEVHFHSSQD